MPLLQPPIPALSDKNRKSLALSVLSLFMQFISAIARLYYQTFKYRIIIIYLSYLCEYGIVENLRNEPWRHTKAHFYAEKYRVRGAPVAYSQTDYMGEDKMKFIRLGQGMWDLSKFPPGVQFSTVLNEAIEDILGTLKKLAEMGYKLIEFVSYLNPLIPASELKKQLDNLGLKTVSMYVRLRDLEEDFNNQIEYALTIGARYIVTSAPKERFASEAEFQLLVDSLTAIGKKLKRRGLQLLYHPHEHEYEIRDAKRLIDRLLDLIDRDLMQMALDLYWAKKGGLDPKAAIQKYRGLIPIIHVKDMDEKGDFTEVGRGTIEWPAIFAKLKDAGIYYYFVEQDISPHPLQSLKMSLDYLKSIGVA